jgi:cytochrome P450
LVEAKRLEPILNRYVPPFPPRLEQDLSPLSLIRNARKNLLSIWPASAFEMQFFGGRILLQHIFVCNSPDTVQAVFVDRAANYHSKSLQQRHALEPLIGDGLFISDGAIWRERRDMVAPVTHVSRLSSLGPVMTDAARSCRENWCRRPSGCSIDVLAEMAHLTAEIICRTIFGSHLGGEAARAVTEAFSAYQSAVGQTDLMSLLGLPEVVPRFQGTKVRRSAARIQTILDHLIDDILSAPGAGEVSLIRGMAEAVSPSTGAPMSRRAFRNEAAVLFMAGHETTANTLAWAWFLLSQAPWAEAAVQAEADCLNGHPAKVEDLPRLRYTRAVIEETLRLYPPVPLQARRAAADDRIRNRAIPAGAIMILVPWLLHRHRQLWERPDSFEPERWLPDGSGAPSRYAYVPFSLGPRVCTGAAFGMTEAVLCLATLAAAFRLRLAPDAVVTPVCRLSLRPGNTLPMILEHRHAPRSARPTPV